MGAHLVEVFRKGLPGGLTVGLKDGQSFIRRDPRNKNSKDEKGGSRVGSGTSKSPSLSGVYSGPMGVCNMKLKGQQGVN